MLEFTIHDMTCGHCVGAITKAIKEVEPQAAVDIDLAGHLVRVGASGDAQAIEDAIREAGYTPVRRN
ncbi:MAG TPA: heavy-metal-associated domain-containing protein [Paucimonas sp.]|nr:heavy-metal-associated domain-containing protein [Paucimonas sp.]